MIIRIFVYRFIKRYRFKQKIYFESNKFIELWDGVIDSNTLDFPLNILYNSKSEK